MTEEPLSIQGQERRGQILLLAQAQARRRRRRRTIGRSGGAALAGGLAVLLIVVAREHTPTPNRTPLPVARIDPPVPVSAPASVAVEYIQSDPTITERLAIKPQPPMWSTIDDRQLLEEMVAAGQPAGIVCMNGKTILLTR